jgi:hypothetical protein
MAAPERIPLRDGETCPYCRQCLRPHVDVQSQPDLVRPLPPLPRLPVGVSYDWRAYRLTISGCEIRLGRRQHEVLRLLLLAYGDVVSYHDLARQLGPLYDPACVRTIVWRLRQRAPGVVELRPQFGPRVVTA